MADDARLKAIEDSLAEVLRPLRVEHRNLQEAFALSQADSKRGEPVLSRLENRIDVEIDTAPIAAAITSAMTEEMTRDAAERGKLLDLVQELLAAFRAQPAASVPEVKIDLNRMEMIVSALISVVEDSRRVAAAQEATLQLLAMAVDRLAASADKRPLHNLQVTRDAAGRISGVKEES